MCQIDWIVEFQFLGSGSVLRRQLHTCITVCTYTCAYVHMYVRMHLALEVSVKDVDTVEVLQSSTNVLSDHDNVLQRQCLLLVVNDGV